MPLIANRDRRKKVQINTEILEEVELQINEYCKWSGVIDIGYFIEEAAKYIFANDKAWQKHLNDLKNPS